MTTVAVARRETLESRRIGIIVHYATLGAIIFVAALLRFTALNRQSLWFDEIDVVIRAQQPLIDVARTFTRAGENGPLFNVLLALWIRLAGVSEIAVRFPSAVAGTLTIPLLYILARRLAGPTAGLLSAGLLAISPYHIWYSQEAKMYALLVLLSVASTLCFVQALEENKPRWWIAYVLTTSLMFYTHVVSVLVFVAQSVYAVITHRSWPGRERWWLAAACALTVPYLPIALWAIKVVGGEVTTWQPDVNLWEAARIIATKFAINRYEPPMENRAASLYAALAFIGAVSLVAMRSRRQWWILLLLLTIVPVVGLWAVSLRQSVFSDRYALVALPAWLMLAGAGIAALLRGKRAWPAGVVALFLVLAFTWGCIRDINRSSAAEKEDWRSAWAILNACAKPGDAIIVHPGYLVTTRDYFVQREPELAAYPVATIPSFAVGWLDRELMIQMLDEQVGGASRLWLVQSPERVPPEDPDRVLETWLRSLGDPTCDHELNGVRVSVYPAP